VPFFDDNPLRKLALTTDTAAASVLDLRGLGAAQALARLRAVIERAGPAGDARAYTAIFDPPAGDGSETLFLPVGRLLLAERRAGRVAKCVPLPEGNGYYFES
jgi:hypothetical protein